MSAAVLQKRRLEVLADATLYTVKVVDGRLKLERFSEDLGFTDVWAIAPGGSRLVEV